MNLRRLFQILGASLVALVICSCEEYPPYTPGLYPRPAVAGWWDDEGVSGGYSSQLQIMSATRLAPKV